MDLDVVLHGGTAEADVRPDERQGAGGLVESSHEGGEDAVARGVGHLGVKPGVQLGYDRGVVGGAALLIDDLQQGVQVLLRAVTGRQPCSVPRAGPGSWRPPPG